MALHNLLTQLKRDEGLRLSAYLNTEGILTIGYGHNCQASPVPSVRHPGDAIYAVLQLCSRCANRDSVSEMNLNR